MKRIILLIISISIYGCTTQNLRSASMLGPDMSKAEVLELMGPPIISEFDKNVEEWFYCTTGIDKDKHIALFFHNGKLIKKLHYTVTWADLSPLEGGSCENFIKRGNYKEPDEVRVIRFQHRP